MRTILIALLFACPLFVLSQDNPFAKKYSEKELNQVNRDDLQKKLEEIRIINDSINKILETDSLLDLYRRASRDTSKAYTSWYLALGPSFGDFGGLNNELNRAGLPELNETSFGFTYILSFAFMKRRFFHDFALGITLGGSNDKDSISLSYNTIDIVNYKLGYSVINAKRFALIPYVGLDLQHSSIYIENERINLPSQQIDNYPDLFATSVNSNPESITELSKTEFMFHYGMEIDYHVKYSKFEEGVILGLRAGGMQPIFDSNWRIDGEKYKQLPDLNLKDTYVQFVLKFYWRNYRKQINPYSNPIIE